MTPMTPAPGNAKTAATRIRAMRWLAFLGSAAVLVLGIGWTRYAHAEGVGDFVVTEIVGPVMELLIGFVGQLLLIMVEVLINIAQYNSFIDSTPVANGWIIVRDLTNMFFILVLLVMAFGTILGVENYSYKNRMLPRLLIMAVVINFSRTICGLLIDFGQVIMLTFVNGFAAAAGGNFIQALKITDLMEPGKVSGGVSGWAIVVAYLLALAIVTISLGVIIIMISVLIMRIIYLWLLVILSPLAFFMKAVPGGKASGYYSEWWSMFTANIVTGPILAFFLWLALVSVAAEGVDDGFGDPAGGEEVGTGGVSKAFEAANIQGFIISIALLLGGVMMAQKAGGAGVGVGKSIATGAGKSVMRAGKYAGGLAARGALAGAGKISLPVGKEVRDAEGKIIGRERVQLASLGGALVGKAKSSGLGRAVGLDKEYSQQKKQEQEVKALRATGQTAKADAQERRLLATMAGKFSSAEGYTGAALKNAYDQAEKKQRGSATHKALSLRMAEEGNFTGKPSDMAAAAGGDKALLESMRAAAKKSGDQFADVDPKRGPVEEQVGNKLAEASEGERNKMIRQLSEGTALGTDGKPKMEFAAAGLMKVDPEHFKKLPEDMKKKMLESLRLGLANDKDGRLDPGDVMDKIKQLDPTGAVNHETSQAKLTQRQDEKMMKERGALLTGGNVQKAFAGFEPEKARFTSDQDLKNIRDFASKGNNAKDLAGAVDSNMLTQNGGVNDLAMAVMENMDVDKMIGLARTDGVSSDKVMATTQAARNIAKLDDADIAKMVAAFKADPKNAGRDAGEYENMIKAAKKSAEVIADASKGAAGPLNAALRNHTFKAGAFRFARDTGGKITVALAATGAGLPVAAGVGALTMGLQARNKVQQHQASMQVKENDRAKAAGTPPRQVSYKEAYNELKPDFRKGWNTVKETVKRELSSKGRIYRSGMKV